MLLLIAKCVFTKKKFFLQRFSYKSSEKDYHLNITITQFARLYKIFSEKPYTNPLKFNHLCRLVPVHGCNLALLPDNLMLQCLISYVADFSWCFASPFC